MNVNLNTITLTGVDNDTNVEQALALAQRFPLLEWGVLYSPTRAGQGGRYPSVERAVAFLTAMRAANVPTAVHLCGQGVFGVLDASDVEGMRLAQLAGRVQMNFNQRRQPVNLTTLERWIEVHNKPLITQHNSANDEVWTTLRNPMHQVLFDASGGRGVLAAQWSAPLEGKFCGYAGGLGPDNVREQVQAITAVCDRRFWIDMEQSLRTEDVFDLALCERVLAALH